MRPVSLSFSGLRSYPGSMAALDFTGKSRVGIVGDTGAGKSTLLEAITLALYGTASWDQSEIKGLIAEGVDVMTVDLTFRCHDQTWRVRRRYHRGRTGSTHLLENLDTGEKIDDRRPVDKRIVQLLRLTFKEFKATVLLPQGRFDQLLHATGTQRIEFLEGIFGTRELKTLNTIADRHHETITDLLEKARIRRAGLLDDPSATSRAHSDLARTAMSHADRVHAIHEQMTSVQQCARTTHARHTRLSEALDSLATAQASVDLGELPSIAQAEGELAEVEAQCSREEADARKRVQDAKKRLSEAARLGVTTETLSAANAFLTDLPHHLQTLKDDRERYSAERARLNAEASDLNTARTRHDARAEHTTQLAAQAAAAKKRADATTTATTQVKEDVREAVTTARKVSATNAAHATALTEADQLRSGLPALERQASDRQRVSEQAAEALSTLWRADAAHAAADGLSAGEPCTVCAQPLPHDYRRPPSTAPTEVATAESTARLAREEYDTAKADLAAARAALASADMDLAAARRKAATEQQALGDALAAVLSDHAAELIFHDETSPIDLDAFRGALAQATAEICQQKPTQLRSAADRRRDAALIDDLCRPFGALAAYRAEHVSNLRDAQHQTEAEVTANAERLQERADSLTRGEHALAEQLRARDATNKRLAVLLAELPPQVGVQLPRDITQITDRHVSAAAETLKDLNTAFLRDSAALAEANNAITTALRRRTELTQRRDTQVSTPCGTCSKRWSALPQRCKHARGP